MTEAHADISHNNAFFRIKRYRLIFLSGCAVIFGNTHIDNAKRIAKHRIFTKPHRIFCTGIIAIFFDKFFLRMNGISVCLAADFIAVNDF